MSENGRAGRTGSGSSRLAELVDALAARLQAGEGVDVEAVARAHPEHASELRRLLPALGALDELSRSGEPASGLGPAAEGAPASGVLGDFRVIREVGRGGMGVVYEAEQISLGRRVALKVLPFAATMDPRQLQRFHNEARAAASLHHEHIVPVYGVGSERGVHYYAMQFVDGCTLADFITRQRRPAPATEPATAAPARGSADGARTTAYTPAPAPAAPTIRVAAAPTEPGPRDVGYFRRVAQWGIDAAEALEHAHGLGIVHRDVKPGNLMLDAQSKLWVTDFGLARTAADSGLTMTGDLLGTLRYMSPEQALARHSLVDHRSDVYSLGASLYELLTGQAAVAGKDRAGVLHNLAFEEPRPPRQRDPGVPADLETVVLKALAKEPAERYATAQELADDLRRFLEDRPIAARRPTLVQRARKWGRRHQPVVASAVLLLALAALGFALGALLLWREREQTGRERDRAEANAGEAARRRQEAVASRRHIDRALREFTRWAEEEGPLASKEVDAKNRPLAQTLARHYEALAALDGEDEETRGIIAHAHAALGLLRRRLGQPAEAERAWRRGIELYQPLGAADRTEPQFRIGLFACWNNLGNLLRDLGRLEEAEDAFRTAVAIQRGLVADYPGDTSLQGSLTQALRNLGLTLRDRGKRGGAGRTHGIPQVNSHQGLASTTHYGSTSRSP
jgi:eukaryotic-like serine/threonine-protein kinase